MSYFNDEAKLPFSEMLFNQKYYISLGYDIESLKKEFSKGSSQKVNIDFYKKFEVNIKVSQIHSNFSKAPWWQKGD